MIKLIAAAFIEILFVLVEWVAVIWFLKHLFKRH